jgi:hypothetical protein
MEKLMNFDHDKEQRSIDRLRHFLPIAAFPRRPLLIFLSARGVAGRGAPRLLVTDLFDAGEGYGLMCRFSLFGGGGVGSFVAPLSHIALDRRHPAARALARLDWRVSRAPAA